MPWFRRSKWSVLRPGLAQPGDVVLIAGWSSVWLSVASREAWQQGQVVRGEIGGMGGGRPGLRLPLVAAQHQPAPIGWESRPAKVIVIIVAGFSVSSARLILYKAGARICTSNGVCSGGGEHWQSHTSSGGWVTTQCSGNTVQRNDISQTVWR